MFSTRLGAIAEPVPEEPPTAQPTVAEGMASVQPGRRLGQVREDTTPTKSGSPIGRVQVTKSTVVMPRSNLLLQLSQIPKPEFTRQLVHIG